jgi:hypothetical protein
LSYLVWLSAAAPCPVRHGRTPSGQSPAIAALDRAALRLAILTKLERVGPLAIRK